MRILLNERQFSCNINEVAKAPLLKLTHLPITILWRCTGCIEVPRMSDSQTEENSLQRATSEQNNC